MIAEATTVEGLVLSFQETRDNYTFYRIHHACLPTLHQVAVRVAKKLPPDAVAVQDLVAYGTRGLWDAALRYDRDTGHCFDSFARPRVRGAMLDELRASLPAGRNTTRWIRRHDEIVDQLTRQHGRTPTEGEVLQALGLPAERMAELRFRWDVSTAPALSQVDTWKTSSRGQGLDADQLIGSCAMPESAVDTAIDAATVLSAIAETHGEVAAAIVHHRIGLDWPQEEVARAFGVDVEFVERVVASALASARRRFGSVEAAVPTGKDPFMATLVEQAEATAREQQTLIAEMEAAAAEERRKACAAYRSLLARNTSPQPEDAAELRRVLELLGKTTEDLTADLVTSTEAARLQALVDSLPAMEAARQEAWRLFVAASEETAKILDERREADRRLESEAMLRQLECKRLNEARYELATLQRQHPDLFADLASLGRPAPAQDSAADDLAALKTTDPMVMAMMAPGSSQAVPGLRGGKGKGK